jgi:hypothetical protein
VVSADYTAWGWIHLILGALVLAAGVTLLMGQLWARFVAVGLAVVSAFTNMLFIAAYPLWSIVAITLDVIVIYAVVVHGREARAFTNPV